MKQENETKKEKQNQVYSITRSYSQNLIWEYEGGHRFEKSDFFSSHSFSFFYEPEIGEIITMSEQLHDQAKLDVKKAIELKKAEIRIQNSPKAQEDGELTHNLDLQADQDEKEEVEGKKLEE